MHGGRALLAVVLVLMLFTSVAAGFTSHMRNVTKGPWHSVDSAQASSTASGTEPVSTEYLSSIAVTGFTTSVWYGQKGPQISYPPSNTGLGYPNTSLGGTGLTTPVYNGFTLFEPGATYNATQTSNSSIPIPTSANAWGWLSSLSIQGKALLIPNGTWTFNTGINVTSSAAGGAGQLQLGIAAYSYNGANSSFTYLFGGTNSTLSTSDDVPWKPRVILEPVGTKASPWEVK